MEPELTAAEIYAQVANALDPTGEIRGQVSLAPALGGLTGLISPDLVTQWQANLAAMNDLIEQSAVIARHLGPRGWAINRMAHTVMAEAASLIVNDRGNEADALLSDQWDRRLVRWAHASVSTFGSAHAPYNELFVHRARLLQVAEDHYLAGRYDAVVMTLLAQIEGITLDVTEKKKFFSRSGPYSAQIYNETLLAALPATMDVLRKVYGETVDVTEASGRLSRHGIVHGRELAYDTKIIAAKLWSLLGAVVEWAKPIADNIGKQRRRELEDANAGSDELDQHGRRVDQREIRETRIALGYLSGQLAVDRRMRGRYATATVERELERRTYSIHDLPDPTGIQAFINVDSTSIVMWRRTISGWVLGLGMTVEDEHDVDWYYAGAEPPSSTPREDAAMWGGHHGVRPPDWETMP